MAGQSDAARRRIRLLTLKAHGFTYEQIAEREAEETGRPPRPAHAIAREISQLLGKKKEINDEQRAFMVTLELERLDALQASTEALLRQARNDGEKALALRAIDRLLRIAERRSALIGLDVKYGQIEAPADTPIDEIKKRRDRKMKDMDG